MNRLFERLDIIEEFETLSTANLRCIPFLGGKLLTYQNHFLKIHLREDIDYLTVLRLGVLTKLPHIPKDHTFIFELSGDEVCK